MFGKSKTKNSGMYNTLSIPANLISGTQSGTNGNGILTEATMLANNIDCTRVMNVVPQWSQATNGNGGVTTISRSSNDNNIYITLTRGSGGSGNVDTTNLVTTNTQQTITGDKQFNANVEFNKVVVVHNGSDNDCGLAFHRDANHANYAGFYNGNNRLGFIGKANANDTTLTLKAETGDLVLNASGNVNASSKKITNLGAPTDNNDAANKQYVDTQITNNKYGDAFTKIYENTVTNNVGSSGTQVINYTNMSSNFSIATNTVYEVLVKQNSNSKDVYANVVIGVNNVDYDNSAITQYLPWGLTGDDSIQYAISLKNNQIKLGAKRGSTSTGDGNAGTQIFIRKIGTITIA